MVWNWLDKLLLQADSIFYWLSLSALIIFFLIAIKFTKNQISGLTKIRIYSSPNVAKDFLIGIISSIVVVGLLKQANISNLIMFLLIVALIWLGFTFTRTNKFATSICKCGEKIKVTAKFCSECGAKQ